MKYLFFCFVLSLSFLQLHSQEVDTTFGEPYSFFHPQIEYVSGITASDFDGRSDRANTMLFLEDGRIIVAGNTHGNDGNDFAFTRLLSDGKYDQSAGPDGEVYLDLGFQNDSCLSASLYQSNKMLMGGCAGQTSQIGCSALIVKLDFDGNLDDGFGNQGRTLLDLPGTWDMVTDIIPLADGKILLAGNIYFGSSFRYPDSTNIFIGRLEPDGQIDSTFGSNGFIYTKIGNCIASVIGDMFVYDDGSFLLTGAGYTPYPGQYLEDFTCYNYIYLYRFLDDGTLDDNFGENGELALYGTQGRGNTIFVYEDGRIVVAGMTSDGLLDPIYTLVARLLPDGTRDSAFNDDGYFRKFIHGVYGYGAEPIKIFKVNNELLIGFLDGSIGPSVTFGAFCLTDEGLLNLNFGNDGLFNHVSIFPFVQYSLSDVRLSEDEQSMYFGGTYRLLSNDNMFISKLDISDKNPTTAQEQVEANSLNIYPNPTTDNFFYLDLPPFISSEDAYLQIRDLTGRVVHLKSLDTSKHKERIEVDLLANGVYFVELFCQHKRYSEKLLVIR
ncbi:MAG: T9SS type A sorting domain-containing protein [Saprospiraceae bacterium]